MAWFKRTRSGADAGVGASEIAVQAVTSGGGRAAAVISGIALLFSAYSLWETSLEQADLGVYVTETIYYARDTSGGFDVREAGGYEVLAVPVTIANGGARDGSVLSLQLEARNPETGQALRFHSAYTVDGAYFVTSDNPSVPLKRPKAPFAPLVVAGRSAWSGTLLFYPADYKEKKLVMPKGKIEATLKLVAPAPSGWLDRVLGRPVPPITLSFDVPDFSTTYLVAGEFARLRSANAQP